MARLSAGIGRAFRRMVRTFDSDHGSNYRIHSRGLHSACAARKRYFAHQAASLFIEPASLSQFDEPMHWLMLQHLAYAMHLSWVGAVSSRQRGHAAWPSDRRRAAVSRSRRRRRRAHVRVARQIHPLMTTCGHSAPISLEIVTAIYGHITSSLRTCMRPASRPTNSPVAASRCRP